MAEQGPSLSQVRITTVTLTSLWWCKSFAQSFCADSLPAAGQLIVVNFFHVLFVSSCLCYSPFKQSHPPLPEKKNYIWFVNRHYNNRELKQQRTTLETRKLQICLSNNFKQFYTLCSCVFWCLYISQPFSFNARRKMTCFTDVWTTWALNEKHWTFSLYLEAAHVSLIPG